MKHENMPINFYDKKGSFLSFRLTFVSEMPSPEKVEEKKKRNLIGWGCRSFPGFGKIPDIGSSLPMLYIDR